MIFDLTILGSSSALPTSAKFPTAHVLQVHERFFLIDCGEGAQMQIRKAKIKFGRINQIFISHIHGDHIFGLFGILSTFNLLGRKYALNIFGPPDLQKVIDFYKETFTDKQNFEIIVHPIEKREYQTVYEDNRVIVSAFPLKHRVSTFAYLFKEKERALNIRRPAIAKYQLTIKQISAIKQGEDLILEDGIRIPNAQLTEPPYECRSYAYCSDTAYYKKNVKFLQGVDLLYHEATFLNSDKLLARKTGHSTAHQAAKIALEANVKQLIIGHFSNRYKEPVKLLNEAQELFSNTHMAEELKTYRVPLRRKSR